MDFCDAFMYGAAIGITQNKIETSSYEEEMIFNSSLLVLHSVLWCQKISEAFGVEDFSEKRQILREAFWTLVNEKDRIEEKLHESV